MDWMSTIKALAPTVASALGSPLAGAAVSALCSIFGVADGTQDTIKTIITNGQMTAEQISKIRELELKYQSEEKERGFRYAELEVKDRDSARQMQTATQSKMPAVITILVTFGFFAILSLLFFHPELKGNEIVMIMVGQLSAVWASCVAFYVGTTYGGQKKTDLLAQSPAIK